MRPRPVAAVSRQYRLIPAPGFRRYVPVRHAVGSVVYRLGLLGCMDILYRNMEPVSAHERMVHFQGIGNGEFAAVHGEPVIDIRSADAHDELAKTHIIVIEVTLALLQNQLRRCV